MAQTYAFSLAGALVLAITVTPVLCMLLFKNFKPVRENLLVRGLKFRYLWKLKLCLKYRWTLLTIMTVLFVGTFSLIPHIGREFMPELEEGNLWIRGTAPLNQTLERNVEIAKQARAIMASFPEVEAILTQSGRPDDGTDIEGYESTEYFVPLRPRRDWPRLIDADRLADAGWGSRNGRGPRRKLIAAMNEQLTTKIPGVTWNFSQNIRDNVMEALSGFKGDNSVKIFGPEIDQLELLATKVKNVLQDIPGHGGRGRVPRCGQSHLEFRVDPAKCQKWGVMTADVNNVITSALGAQPSPAWSRARNFLTLPSAGPSGCGTTRTSILDIPVDIVNNQVVLNHPGHGQRGGFDPDGEGLRSCRSRRPRAFWPTPPIPCPNRLPACASGTWFPR